MLLWVRNNTLRRIIVEGGCDVCLEMMGDSGVLHLKVDEVLSRLRFVSSLWKCNGAIGDRYHNTGHQYEYLIYTDIFDVVLAG